MGIIELGHAWLNIMEAFQKIEEPKEQKAVLCMTIDLVAANCGMESVELLDRLRPHIKMVNECMGRMEWPERSDEQ